MGEKDKRYYWLKLKRDFFKRHDIRIIEAMPNGKDYILFYLKLLCESVDHDGNLRFSDKIPYSEEMLATITNTNVDVVRAAIQIFTELGMMEMYDDGTYFMSEVKKLMGSETYWAERKRVQREPEAPLLENVQQMSNECPTCPGKSKSKIKSKSKTESKSKTDDPLLLNQLKEGEAQLLLEKCGSGDVFERLIRYAEYKIEHRMDSTPITDMYQYLIQVGINGGFINAESAL